MVLLGEILFDLMRKLTDSITFIQDRTFITLSLPALSRYLIDFVSENKFCVYVFNGHPNKK